MIPYEQLRDEVARRRRERWGAILATEPQGRPAGRRPRDAEQEQVLLERDRARLAARRAMAGDSSRRRS